jgi:hypothetical protein
MPSTTINAASKIPAAPEPFLLLPDRLRRAIPLLDTLID